MATSTIVDVLHREIEDLLAFLDAANEVSLRNTVDDNFRKALLLAGCQQLREASDGKRSNLRPGRFTAQDHVVGLVGP